MPPDRFKNGHVFDEADFIDESERDSVTPANDALKVPKLEADGLLSPAFLPGALDTQVFTANGTWTKPGKGTLALIELWGAGASGGAAHGEGTADRATGGGGGGGEYIAVFVPLALLEASYSVVVGQGGAPVTAAAIGVANAGNDGGDTSFGSLLNAIGGNAGGADSGSLTAFAGGGSGGTGGTTDVFSPIKESGGGGGSANANNTGNSVGNDGGDKTYAPGGGGGSQVNGDTPTQSNGTGGTSTFSGNGGDAANGTASDGATPGGGGGGATVGSSGTATSGAGGDGYCRVTVF